MTAPEPPTIDSFILRFVTDPETQTFRGEIRHVQSGEELSFTRWQDAEAFLFGFVPGQSSLTNDSEQPDKTSR